MLKSWQDLHVIWWGCLKERNWLSTDEVERKRVEAGYGDYEKGERMETVCSYTHFSMFIEWSVLGWHTMMRNNLIHSPI